MDFILDLLQAAGIAAAIGIRPLMPVALTGGSRPPTPAWTSTARTSRSSRSRGSSGGGGGGHRVVAGDAACAAGGARARLGRVRDRRHRRPLALLEGAGSMADGGHPAWVGMAVGLVCVSIGLAASVSLFARVRRRLDPEAASYLPLYGEGAALVACGLSILFPPLALLVLAGLLWLLLANRRREGEKYAGLRILR
jgi:hypothetical protein